MHSWQWESHIDLWMSYPSHWNQLRVCLSYLNIPFYLALIAARCFHISKRSLVVHYPSFIFISLILSLAILSSINSMITAQSAISSPNQYVLTTQHMHLFQLFRIIRNQCSSWAAPSYESTRFALNQLHLLLLHSPTIYSP